MELGHNARVNWRDYLATQSDDGIEMQIRHVANFLHEIGGPNREQHHTWAAIRCAVLHESRKRGIDASAIAPTRK